jgi:phospholipase C
MDKIEHVVHVMFENRSFDNLLGYLYSPADLPPNPPAAQPPFNGLAFGGPYGNINSQSGQNVAVSEGTQSYGGKSPNVVPTPDPGEPFSDVYEQLFNGGAAVTMGGFVNNYAKQPNVQAVGQIMESYSPAQVPVLSTLARSFAVSDSWFCSVPTQTWPNRGFAHCGWSDGHLINKPYVPWGCQTIFNVLEDAQISWGVFFDTIYTPPLTRLQFFELMGDEFDSRFARFGEFSKRCAVPANAPASAKLPKYSFVEPRFMGEWWLGTHHSESYHPPENILHGEDFLASVYNAIQTSPYRDRILLVITFDEHGGTYDHVPPPDTAAATEAPINTPDGSFDFKRFGVRVPAILVSSWVKPGSVFRAPGAVPLDHTSVLATLRDWLQIPAAGFLPSARIAAAPTLQQFVSENAPIANWPQLAPPRAAAMAVDIAGDDDTLQRPPDDLDLSIVGATGHFVSYRNKVPLAAAIAAVGAAQVPATRREATDHVREMVLALR